MTLKERIAIGLLARWLRKRSGTSRAEWRRTMKPFPKWMMIVFGFFSAGPVAYAAYKTGEYGIALMTLLGALGLANTHSLTGTGGQPQ